MLDSGTRTYACNWMKCAEMFQTPAQLRAHLFAQHFEAKTFRAQCRVPGGRWEEWRRAHAIEDTRDAGLLPVSARSPSGGCSPKDLSSAKRDSFHTPSPQTGPISGSWPDHVEQEFDELDALTPSPRKDASLGERAFTSFSSLDTPIRTPQVVATFDVSPAFSDLVRRMSSQPIHFGSVSPEKGSVMSLPPVLATEDSKRSFSPSVSSDGFSPSQKRPRLDLESETSVEATIAPSVPVLEGSQSQPEVQSHPPEEYPYDSDDSFPEFLD